MTNILKFTNKSVGVIGDIHGEFRDLFKILKNVTDSIIIVAGDCGFGFPDTKIKKIEGFYNTSMNKFLLKRNLILLFLRGNHDNPMYFNDKKTREKISKDNFMTIPDYTIVEVDDKKILCIGGGISIDRSFRVLNKSYWKDEKMKRVKYIKDVKFDVVITHVFDRRIIEEELFFLKLKWLSDSITCDPTLKRDTEIENRICRRLLDFYKPKLWLHGHYHYPYRINKGETIIKGLDINELYQIR